MNIETLAVAAVTREISRTQRLAPFLNANDKEPVWDGYVAVYKSPAPHRIEDLVMRINVQIKGQKGRTDELEIRYSVKLADLRCYRNDNPTVFFVVRMDEAGREAVYSCSFTKERAEELVRDHARQQTVSVPFQPFPSTEEEKEALFFALAGGQAEPPSLAAPAPLSDTDIFRYDAKLVGFYGREKEIERLNGFLEAPGAFRWWGVIGPGGAGKSRLGLEWGKQVRESGWTVRTLRAADYKNLDALTERHSGPLLLIADYARQHAGALGAWMERLCDAEPAAPVRLLLLERDEGADAAGETAWEKELYHAGDEGRLRRARHERLLPLPKLDKSPLEALILDFAARLRERNANLPALTEAEAKTLVKRLGELDRDCRPLYAMILTDAYLRDPAAAHWTQEALLNGLVTREREQLKKAVQSLQPAGERLDTALLDAALRLRRLATALGASNDRGLEELLKLEPVSQRGGVEVFAILRARAPVGQPAQQRVLAQQVGAQRRDEGEYALLRWLTDGSTRPQDREDFYAAALGDRKLRAFYQRLYADYAPLLNGRPTRWKSLLPAALPLEGDAAARYTHLLNDGFDRCTDRAQRQRLLTETARYADAVQEETPAAANIFNNLGLLYKAMGDYPRALEYHRKSLAISEKALGPEHPDTATSYNNLGTVYRATREYPRALEYYQKALAIKEKALGPEHPSTATSYNNLGTVYCATGEYPRALECCQKALAIVEKALGPEHPYTATSYNNLGLVYDDMGDYPRALECHRKALAIDEKALGPEHPNTKIIQENLNLLKLLAASADADGRDLPSK